MANRSDFISLPPAVRRAASAFRIAGWVSFWAQIVLAVISAGVLAFAGLNSNANAPATPNTVVNPAANTSSVTGFGLFFAACGLIALFAGAYWAFNYTRLARRLQTADSRVRPKPKEAIQALQIGLLINLVGMIATILGAQAIVGSLVARSMAQGFAVFAGTLPAYISPLQIFVVQANINIIMAHFVGAAATLWLIRTMNRQ
jgi:amino acid transporter